MSDANSGNAEVILAYPWTVVDTENSLLPILGRFATHDQAAEFISTLPDHASGRYGLDGPEVVGDLNEMVAELSPRHRAAPATLGDVDDAADDAADELRAHEDDNSDVETELRELIAQLETRLNELESRLESVESEVDSIG